MSWVLSDVSVLAEKYALFFHKEHSVNLDLGDIYEALRTKKVMLLNSETDVNLEVSDIAILIAELLIQEISRCWGNAINMCVFVAGGDAPYFIGAIRKSIPHAERMDDNLFAVARGMHLYLKAKSGT